MIAALRGPIVRWDEDRSLLWVEAAGVTYEVLIPAYAREWVTARAAASDIHVYTFYHATERQPIPTLIGFPRLAERDFFRKFIEVPDVGPVKAVRALARPVSEIARWIEAGDVAALRQLPGIGERLAQTLVAHLRGKLLQEALLRDQEGTVETAVVDLRTDAVDALLALQFGRQEADRLVRDALLDRPELDVLEDVLRHVLEQQASHVT